MSIDLDWGSLDYHLTQSVTNFLSSAFSSASRPNFIGPLSVESFSFGHSEPTLELTDIRDVYKEFLQDPPPPDVHLNSEEYSHRPPRPLSRARTRSRSPNPPHHPTYNQSDTQTHPGAHSYDPPSPVNSHFSLPPDHPTSSFPPPSSAPSPSFQIHLHLTYSGTLSLGISTSLLINYPSPNFMALPLSLTITSIALEATLVVAFEGGNRSIHLSLLDPNPGGGGMGTRKESAGNRILKSAVVESEVGQADKHVLKNVGKVEKFVLEVARKTLENEIVFPNFQTILF
ncbi:hypothetical protein JCM16303_000308 [Sporobolomyces ruberrimus]